MRRPSAAIARALAAALLLLAALGTRADAQSDPRQQREEVRKQKAAAAADVNALKASAADVQRALTDLQANVAGQEAALADATLAANVAAEAAAKAKAEAEAARTRVEGLKGQLKQVAVDAYVGGDPADAVDTMEPDPEPARSLAKQALVRFRANQGTAVLEQLKSAQEDADTAQAQADKEAAAADAKRAEIGARTAQVRAARDQQAAYAQQVEARLDRRLSEAASLEAQDKNLSQQITAQEAALAARVVRSGGGGGGSAPPFSSGGVALTTTRGITVASSIADQLVRMIDAAAADGISLSGSGYRDPARQQALREQNCANPASDPPSACRPPTARPGSSMHERGLAIDFSANGSLIQSRGNPGYAWLASNAASYGFYNLPAEPWHWSTTGD